MVEIEGKVEPRFEEVARAFRRNFEQGKEIGASVSIYHRGRRVVDLWGGLADPESGRSWRRDTLAVVASTTKAMAAISMLVLVDRGVLELDTPVAAYWPEFAAEGKDEVTPRGLLSHRAGVVSLEEHPVTYEDLVAGAPIIDAIAAARPQWRPGSAHGYHGLTFGHAISGVIQRVTGLTVGKFFAREIAVPLGLDCFIDLPETEVPRLATMVLPSDEEVALGMQVPEMAPLFQALNDPSTLTYRAMYGSIAIGWESANDPKYVQVESPSMDGVGTADGLARMFAATIGEIDGVRLLGPEVVEQARTVHSSGTDRVLAIRTDWGLGFQLPGGPLFDAPRAAGAFGHGGATGSFAFADPDWRLAFGYVPNRGSELLEGSDLRAFALIEAAYRSLGR